MFSQASPPFFLNDSGAHQQESVEAVQSSASSIENNSGWTNEAKKGVTYPSYQENIMAGISF